MVIKKLLVIFFFVLCFINKETFSSQILDYETEVFISDLINEIKISNNIEKKLNFKIISDENINAFVDQNNIIYITSGLIENCNDYVALVSVISHEIGHIDNNHIKERIYRNSKLNNINTFSSLSIIASSMLFNNPEIIKSLAISSGALSEHNIVFSKEQEKEADYYSLESLKRLNLYSNSIIELLLTIEIKSNQKGITKEKLKYGTHPYFEDRINIINYLKRNQGVKLNDKKNNRFKFIQAKFIGYSGNTNLIKNLEEPYENYANAILNAKNGNLRKSLNILNQLISTYKSNLFLIETKADILFSYGYTNESIEFYRKVLMKYPDNGYAQIRVFENTNFEQLSEEEIEKLFLNNLNLLNKYYNNKNLLILNLHLSYILKKNEWKEFLNYWINKQGNKKLIMEELQRFKKTKDKNLYNLIQLIYKDLK